MPSSPSWCCTKNVTLMPMKNVQKCTLPHRSFIILPVIFGNQ